MSLYIYIYTHSAVLYVYAHAICSRVLSRFRSQKDLEPSLRTMLVGPCLAVRVDVNKLILFERIGMQLQAIAKPRVSEAA